MYKKYKRDIMREESNIFELLKTIMNIAKTVIPAILEALYTVQPAHNLNLNTRHRDLP